MKLSRWLKLEKADHKQFCETVGISSNSLYKYLRGTRRPNLDQALAIERATKGKVPVEEWEGKACSDDNPLGEVG